MSSFFIDNNTFLLLLLLLLSSFFFGGVAFCRRFIPQLGQECALFNGGMFVYEVLCTVTDPIEFVEF